MVHKTNTESKRGQEGLKQRTKEQFLRLVAAVGVTAGLAACGGAKPTESAPVRLVTTEVASTTTSTSIAVPEATTTHAPETTTTPPKYEQPKVPETVPFIAGKRIGTLTINAPGTGFDDLTNKGVFPQEVYFENPGIEDDPVLHTGVGLAGVRASGSLMPQPGQYGNAVIFGHRTTYEASFRPIYEIYQKNGIGIDTFTYTPTDENGETNGTPLTFVVTRVEMLHPDIPEENAQIYRQDLSKKVVSLYGCGYADGSPGGDEIRVVVRAEQYDPVKFPNAALPPITNPVTARS